MEPEVYGSVRAVGTLKPKFQPNPRGTVFADTLDVRGTAFWLKAQKILITCAHVVQDLAGIPVEIGGLLVVGNRGNYSRAKLGIVDYDHDLAVLHPDLPPEILEKESSQGLDIAAAYPIVGTQVAYAGFPLGTQLLDGTHSPTYAEGVIGAPLRQLNLRKTIQITGTVVGGFSGSPIIDKSNPTRVVAVASNSPSREAGEADIFMGISWEHVKAIAELSRS